MLLQVRRQTLHQLLLKCGLIVPLMRDVCAYVLIRQHTHSLSLYIVAFCFCRTDCCACCGTGRRSRYIYIYILHTHTHTHTHTHYLLISFLISTLDTLIGLCVGLEVFAICLEHRVQLTPYSAPSTIRNHTSPYVSICQHMSAYVSIRQDTSASRQPPFAQPRAKIPVVIS